MPTALRNDPYGIAHFQVEIDGLPESGFLNVSGLEGRVEVEEYREGGDLGLRKAPGNVTYSHVGGRRGMASSLAPGASRSRRAAKPGTSACARRPATSPTRTWSCAAA